MLGLGLIILALVASSASSDHCDEKSDDCSAVKGSSKKPFDQDSDWETATSIYQFHARDINGSDVSLEKYRGRVLIVVNVASECGLTDTNYKQLVALYEKYRDSEGLGILAFPSNQFGGQEPGNSTQILEFIRRYDVRFDVFEKIDVNGDNAHPLWKWLRQRGPGFLTNDVKWNFTKFVIDEKGDVVRRFAPTVEPASLEKTLQSLF